MRSSQWELTVGTNCSFFAKFLLRFTARANCSILAKLLLCLVAQKNQRFLSGLAVALWNRRFQVRLKYCSFFAKFLLRFTVRANCSGTVGANYSQAHKAPVATSRSMKSGDWWCGLAKALAVPPFGIALSSSL